MIRPFLFCLTILLSLTTYAQDDFYKIEKIHEVKLTFKQDNWATILHNMKKVDKGDRLTASLMLNGKTYEQVGVRFKGNSSYYNVKNGGSTKLPFNVKSDHKIEDQTFPGGFDRLKLSNVFRDPSYLREALSYEIAHKYMPSPTANFAKIYANDTYLGLYNNTESIDNQFLMKYFGEDEGTLIKCDPAWHSKKVEGCPVGDKASLMYLGDDPACYANLYEMKTKDPKGWTELIELTKVLNETPEKIEQVLDVDKALWMLAFNNILLNLDSYTGRLGHNYYLYKTQNGQFAPLIWDMNLSFGGFRFAGTGKAMSNEELSRMSPLVHYKTRNAKRPLIVNLLAQPLYRKIYLGHMRTILEENFSNGEYLKRATAIQALIDTEVRNDSNKLYPYEDFKKNVNESAMAGRSKIVGIKELMVPRIEYLNNHPLLKDGFPTISDAKHTKNGEDVAFNITATDANNVYVMYRSDKTERFKKVKMKDNGSQFDEMGDDNIFGAIVPYVAGTEYYFVVEGTKSAMMSPRRAAHEFYTVE